MGPPELIMSLDGHYDFYESKRRIFIAFCFISILSDFFVQYNQEGRRDSRR